MRLNARTGAALLAILVGLVLIVIATLGPNTRLPGTLKPAPPIPIATGTLTPLDPMAGIRTTFGAKGDKGDKDAEAPEAFNPTDVFATEYGDRGVHKVTVTISANGSAGYAIYWRDGKSEKGTTSGLTRTRSIRGGLPLAQVGIQGLPASRVTCTITIDGAEKTSKSTQQKFGITLCNG